PANTCATPPSLPGSAKDPSDSVSAVSFPSSSATIDQYAQLGADSIAASPSRHATHSSDSSPSFGAVEVFIRRCTCSRPAIDSGLDSCASHVPPSFTAIAPPFSQMNGRALYQSLPGNQTPETPVVSASFSAFSMYSS